MRRDVYAGLTSTILVLLFFAACFAGCTSQAPAAPVTAAPTAAVTQAEPQTLVIATTTSLYDTKLLDYLQTKFEAKNNVKLKITSQGTGKAIELAKKGDADILLVHSPTQETVFLESGNGLNRRTFAYNYFIIVGPASDPAGIKGKTPEEAFKTILTRGKAGNASVVFVSRGDASGTHSAEQNIWKSAGYNYSKDVQKSGDWYIEAGKGMGETLQMASEKKAYTLTDEGTYLSYKSKLNLEPIVSEGKILMNQYSVMSVYNSRQPVEKIQLANSFINFLISPETMADIGNFGKDTYGKALFTPMSAGVPAGVTADFTTPATAVKPLKVYHAGSLASSMGKAEKAFEKTHADTDVQLFSGGSAAIIDKVAKQNEYADVLASADATLIPKYMYPSNATFEIDFAKNTMVLVYTDKSREASTITADNWYKVLAKEGVVYAISDPTADPAGYRSLMTIVLAEQKYGDSTIFATVVEPYSKITKTTDGSKTTITATSPTPDGKKMIIAKTGPELIPLLKEGKVDYAFEYSSVAIQSGLPYLKLPAEIDLSDPSLGARYANVVLVRPSGTTTVTETAAPIIYAMTIPTSTRNSAGAGDFVNLLITSDGQAILTADGQTPISPAVASGTGLPAVVLPNVKQV
jgi:tungstate transport system substrate-binding protein